jgi:hypothetical protein
MVYAIEDSAVGEIVFSDRQLEARLDRRESASAEIGSGGGSLVLEDCLGSRVSLAVPPYALLSSREIKMTCLGSRPVDTLGSNVFPGILLEPSGLIFRYPAELRVFLPEPVEDPERNSIFTLGVDGIPRPVSNTAAAGQFLVGEVRHFSEYWGDSANLADIFKSIDLIILAKGDPEFRKKLLAKFREEMGYELDIEKLDIETLEFIRSLAELDAFAQFRRLTDILGADLDKVPDPLRDFLEVLVLDFKAKPFPKNHCGYFHSFALELRDVAKIVLDYDPDLDAKIDQLDTLCVPPDLTGWWRAESREQSEVCERIIKPVTPCNCGPDGYDRFTEYDFTKPYRFFINQVGSYFTISLPEEPGAPFFVGTLQATGNILAPFHLRLAVPPENSLECKTFFETKGSFEFGDSICVPADYNECEPVSCYDQETLWATVTGEGRIEGVSRWLIGARVIEWLDGCCDYLTNISCSGSGPFVAVPD